MNINLSYILQQSLNNFKLNSEGTDLRIDLQKVKDEIYDGVIYIQGVAFSCLIEQDVTSTNYGRIKRRLEQIEAGGNMPILLIGGYIASSLYPELKQSRINFMDSVGNCFISHINKGSMILHISHSGIKSSYKASVAYPLFREAGLKVIFYLLQSLERFSEPFRTIRDGSGVSIGTVKNVMDELASRGYILITQEKRVLVKGKQLLDDWAENYALVLKPKLLLQRFSFRSVEKREEWQSIMLPSNMWWGGECAAAKRQGYLIPENFMIYGATLPAQLMSTGSVLMGNGEIALYKKFWVEEGVPAVLVYADLVTSGRSRNIEAANKLLDNELPDFK